MSASYTVLIPALNEEEGIVDVIKRVKNLQPTPAIIVIDDGSTDKTGEVAKAAGATVLRHPIPGGYGRSIKDGIRAASTDIIAITDADGTYPVERFPEMVKMIEEGHDMVVGARHGKHYRGSFFKMPARIVFKFLVEFTTGRHIPDINSGLRTFRKSEMQKFESDLCNGFSFTTTSTLIYLLTGKFVSYVPVDYGARTGVSKVHIVRDTLRTLQYITETIATYNPLKLFILMSGILALGAVVSVVEAFILHDLFFVLLGSVLLVGAFTTFGMGLLAHPKSVESKR